MMQANTPEPDKSLGNYGDKTLQVFSINANTLQPHGLPITLPGQPASIRGVAR